MDKKLELERKSQEAKGKVSDRMMMTPPIDEDYWLFRVKLYKDQAGTRHDISKPEEWL